MCECLCVYARIAYLQTPSRLEATMRGNVFRPAANGIGEGWTFFFGMGGGGGGWIDGWMGMGSAGYGGMYTEKDRKSMFSEEKEAGG